MNKKERIDSRTRSLNLPRTTVLSCLFSLVSITLFGASGALAGEPVEACIESDEWACECPLGLSDLAGACTLLDTSELTPLDDPAAVDTSEWIQSSWNEDTQVWNVVVDLRRTEHSGIFVPLTNRGHWQSQQEVRNYVSALLEVPLQPNGKLEAFHVTQRGSAVVYEAASQTRHKSTGNFWLDLITDSDANLHVGGELLSSFDEDNCTVEETDVDQDTGLSQEGQALLRVEICVKSFDNFCSFFDMMQGEMCDVNNLPAKRVSSSSKGSVASVIGLDYEVERDASSIFECDEEGQACALIGGFEYFPGQPAKVRFTRVTGNIDLTHQSYLRHTFQPAYSASNRGTDVSVQFERINAVTTYLSSDPAYNTVCSNSRTVRDGDEILLDGAVHIAVPNDSPPGCFVTEVNE